jgi:hypothetical protein
MYALAHENQGLFGTEEQVNRALDIGRVGSSPEARGWRVLECAVIDTCSCNVVRKLEQHWTSAPSAKSSEGASH